jgi:hypothetical protein
MLVAALNLLDAAHGGADRPLGAASIAANLGALWFLIVLATVEPFHAPNPTYVALALVAVLAVLSLRGR